MRMMFLGAAAIALGACGGGGEQKQAKPAAAASLQPGEYEVTGTVADLKATDNTAPATQLKAGATLTPVRACVAADGKIDIKLLAEPGDECKEDTAFVRNGRLNVQLNCQRAGKGGVMQLANGTFKENSFEAEILSSSYFTGTGDYSATRKVTGKRVGDCPATQQG